jgi:hypothetical protein
VYAFYDEAFQRNAFNAAPLTASVVASATGQVQQAPQGVFYTGVIEGGYAAEGHLTKYGSGAWGDFAWGMDRTLVARVVIPVRVDIAVSAQSLDTTVSRMFFVATVSELAAGRQVSTGKPYWDNVDDTQPLNWQNVADQQDPNWGLVAPPRLTSWSVQTGASTNWSFVNDAQQPRWSDVDDYQPPPLHN